MLRQGRGFDPRGFISMLMVAGLIPAVLLVVKVAGSIPAVLLVVKVSLPVGARVGLSYLGSCWRDVPQE